MTAPLPGGWTAGDATSWPGAGRRARLVGIDAARALALAGMAWVHILPVRHPDGTDTLAGAVAGGRASALFAVLAGVGVALATRATPFGRPSPPPVPAGVGPRPGGVAVASPGTGSVRGVAEPAGRGAGAVPDPYGHRGTGAAPPGRPPSGGTAAASPVMTAAPGVVAGPPGGPRAHAGAAAGLVVRGVLVALLGLALVGLRPPVAVILPYYGLLFVLATPLLRLRWPALAGLAALWCVVGPVASHVLRAGREALPGPQPGFGALAAPSGLLRELLLTGYYPALPWLTYLLVGMAVGRAPLWSPRVAAGLLGGGAALAAAASAGSALLLGPGGGAGVLGPAATMRRYGTVPTDTWWWLAVRGAHTGTPFDLAHTAGTALAVIGAMLLLARVAPALSWLLGAVGAMPLTLYALHVTALAVFPPKAATAAGIALGTLLGVHLAVALVIGVLVRATGLRGPLEAVVGAASRAARRAVTGGAGAGGAGAGRG